MRHPPQDGVAGRHEQHQLEAWQVIRTPEQMRALHRINVISYERLRLPLDSRTKPEDDDAPAAPRKGVLRARKTYAGQLRRRVGVVISDEGDLMANPESQQSRCLAHVSGKRRYVLSGTPIANQCRDILPILAYACGNGTAAQPYSFRGLFLEPRLIQSMNFCTRGIDAFRDSFVVTEWVTREFEDTLTEGAKREIPKINNLDQYRALVAPHIKRRIAHEPEVAACITMPKATYATKTVEWDDAHLRYFLDVAHDFTSWYMGMRRKNGDRGGNLIAILARIQAVSTAQDFPQMGVDGFGAYNALTSKQRYTIDRLAQLTAEGHKTILYAHNPGVLELIHRELAKRDIEGVLFHGGIAVHQRTRALNGRFRHGPAPVLEASLGVTQKGLNLYQADRVLLYSRSWSATTESQAIGRPLRPQQTRQVGVEYVHLNGSLDIYKDQMVSFKGAAASAGLDWGEQDDDAEFLHLDTVIWRFCEDLARMRGIKTIDLRKPHGRKRFCSNRCKDRFHNRTNPRGYGLRARFQGNGDEPPDFDPDDVALHDATAGWDEDGWRDDDSGVGYF